MKGLAAEPLIDVDTCPSDEQLSLVLSGADEREIALHVRQCARCQRTLDLLSDDDSLRPAEALSDEGGWNWGDPTELSLILEAVRNLRAFDRGRTEPGNGPHTPFAYDLAQKIAEIGTLGAYEIDAEIGRGGMGAVFLARDRTTGRRVALKVLFAGTDDERTRRRFVQEVRAAAKVEHDHIVRLYATSDPSDRIPYFVMEYLPGPSLAGAIAARGRIPAREAAELLAQAALGVEAAHQAGLVHSDVKPANILLDPATGRAKVGDFGVARVESETVGLSREGILAGTPAYLSPEQARGETKPDPRSDIYGLGVTLYECLTGEPPFRGEPHRILHQVLNDEPRPPRVFDDAIPRDLETICLKAMTKDAPRRYARADDLAADLRRFLKGEPILARPAGLFERFWRWCRNNRRIAALSGLVSLLLVALTMGSLVASVMIFRARTNAVENARRADLERGVALAARADAVKNAQHADVQRGLALDALSSLIQGIQDQLATRPGTLELRRTLLEIARAGLSRMPVAESDGTREAVDDRSIQALIKLGDIDFLLGRTADARAEFDQAARLAERVSSADPQSVPIRRQLGAAYDRLGDEVSHTYTSPKDEAAYREKSLAIRLALFAEHSGDPQIRRDLQVAQNKLAGFHAKNGDHEAASKLYEESLKSLKSEPITDKNRTVILSDLRFVQSRMALEAFAQVRVPEALAASRESLASAKALCAIDAENVSYRRQLGFALAYLGMVCLEIGELEEAEANFVAFRENRQAAVDADPADQEALRNLALAHQHLGDLAKRRREFDKARVFYKDGLARFEGLARRDPTSVMAHKERLIAYRKLASLETLAGRNTEAADWCDRELRAQDEKGVPAYPDRAGWVAEARLYRDVYRLLDSCIDNPALARAQPPTTAMGLLELRAVVLARNGRAPLAAEAARELVALRGGKIPSSYAAHAYAIAAASLDQSQSNTRSEYRKSAVIALRQALVGSRLQAKKFWFDPDFRELRDDPDFIALARP